MSWAEDAYVVVAIPPHARRKGGLSPRCQTLAGEVALSTKSEAYAQADACTKDNNGWRYEAMSVALLAALNGVLGGESERIPEDQLGRLRYIVANPNGRPSDYGGTAGTR